MERQISSSIKNLALIPSIDVSFDISFTFNARVVPSSVITRALKITSSQIKESDFIRFIGISSGVWIFNTAFGSAETKLDRFANNTDINHDSPLLTTSSISSTLANIK